MTVILNQMNNQTMLSDCNQAGFQNNQTMFKSDVFDAQNPSQRMIGESSSKKRINQEGAPMTNYNSVGTYQSVLEKVPEEESRMMNSGQYTLISEGGLQRTNQLQSNHPVYVQNTTEGS